MRRFQTAAISSGLEIRVGCWEIGIVEILENPFFGVGLGNSYLLASNAYYIGPNKYGIFISAPLATDWVPYEYYYPRGIRDIHNVYLQIGAEAGLPTLVVFLLMLISLAGLLVRSLKKVPVGSRLWALGLGIGLSYLFILITGVSEPSLNRKYFWLVIGLILSYENIINQLENQTVSPNPTQSF